MTQIVIEDVAVQGELDTQAMAEVAGGRHYLPGRVHIHHKRHLHPGGFYWHNHGKRWHLHKRRPRLHIHRYVHIHRPFFRAAS